MTTTHGRAGTACPARLTEGAFGVVELPHSPLVVLGQDPDPHSGHTNTGDGNLLHTMPHGRCASRLLHRQVRMRYGRGTIGPEDHMSWHNAQKVAAKRTECPSLNITAVSRRLCAGPRAASRGAASSGLLYGARKRWRKAAFASRTSPRSPGTRRPVSRTIPGSSLSTCGTWDSADSQGRSLGSRVPVRLSACLLPRTACPCSRQKIPHGRHFRCSAAPHRHDTLRRDVAHVW